MSTPTIAISIGDPAGIGPEICFKAVCDAELCSAARWILIGDAWLADHPAVHAQCRPTVISNSEAREFRAEGDDRVLLFDQSLLSPDHHVLGQANAECGKAALGYVTTAAKLCIDGSVDAMVTAPICKEAVVMAGQAGFCGHTEYIAALCGVDEPRLMLYHEQLRIVHVSTHVSLAEAIRLCTADRILETIRIGEVAMHRLGWREPRIAVCGLNPHAGENGMFGSEESQHIVPAIEAAKKEGILCSGPYPADTLLLQALRGKYDLVVGMYHDQGHAPMKLYDFEHCVNVTLGLPIIRTSVGHGTAFDIAGTHSASAEDLKCAMRLAIRMTNI